ncbi:MAG: amidase [Pararhodobacter sp.]
MIPILAQAAHEQLAAVHTGQMTAEDLMRATLEQVARCNPVVNAIVALRDTDALMAEARAADKALLDTVKQGKMPPPLLGLPMAVKDLADVRGLPSSMGSPLFAGQAATRDSLFVARLRAAGALFIGKTNTPEFGLGSHTVNRVHGATGNAWAPALSAGGSSGGAAVALALRMVALADGSDMMGSLRNPAGWNHVYGFRPSWGRVPDRPDGESFLHPLATNGPMARCPRDLALMLDVMAGPEPTQPFSLPAMRFDHHLRGDLRGRRIGWLGDWGGTLPMEPGILAVCEAALDMMARAGAVVDTLPPPFPAQALWQSWLALRAFANAARLGPLYAVPAQRARLKDTAIWEIEQGRALTLQAVQEASLIRSQWYAQAAALFDRFDALALPTAQVWPFALDQEYPRQINGQAMDTYHRWMEVVVPASLIGLPALAVPAGFGSQGVPMGLQLIGRHGADQALLQLAQGWHQINPLTDHAPPGTIPPGTIPAGA